MTALTITKETVATVEEKLEAFATKLAKGLNVSLDSEIEPKDGYFSITVYFENPEQVAAINKAKAAIAKQVAAGTLGQEPEKKPRTTKPAAAKEEAAEAPATVVKASVAAAIVKELGEYGVKVTAEQVQAGLAGKVDARLAKQLAKLVDDEDRVAEFAKKKVSLLIAALCLIEFSTKDATVNKLMAAAVKKVPDLAETEEAEAEAEEEVEDEVEDEEEDEAPAKKPAAKSKKAAVKVEEEDEEEEEDADWDEEEEEDDDAVEVTKAKAKSKK